MRDQSRGFGGFEEQATLPAGAGLAEAACLSRTRVARPEDRSVRKNASEAASWYPADSRRRRHRGDQCGLMKRANSVPTAGTAAGADGRQ